MRVVGGSARGRRLHPPPAHLDVRPTSDRVRESIFNVVMSLGGVDDATVVDLFAGTGALGIEALSRGARRATFVERDARAAALIERNLDATGFADDATVVRADAVSWARAAAPVDVAFADPPYAFAEWPTLLDVLQADLLVIESDRELDLGARWRVLRVKHYGSTVVAVAQPADTNPTAAP